MKKTTNATVNTISAKELKKAQKAHAALMLVQFNELTALHDEMLAIADCKLAIDYEQDLIAHNYQTALDAIYIESAQRKRNLSVATNTTSLFCRLTESTRQNYRIDKSLETMRSMREHMTATDCSEARIKSHVVYIMKNCLHAERKIDATNNKKFCFVVK